MYKHQLFIKISSLLVGLGILFFLVIMAECKYAIRKCDRIQIVVQPYSDQEFITEGKLKERIIKNIGNPLGSFMKEIQTHAIIRELKNNDFIKNILAYKTWRGELVVLVTRKKILARTISKSSLGQYIDDEGQLIPLSPDCTARVLLLEYGVPDRLYDDLMQQRFAQLLLPLLKYINSDPFWHAQVAHLRYSGGEASLYMRIGRQVIEFGKPISIKEKFMKLKYFYQAVIPYKGWNAYSRVNLAFKNQLVCE